MRPIAALCLSVGLFLALPARAAEMRLGVLPLRLAPGLTTGLPTGEFVASLSQAIRKDLELADVGQVTLLPWPEALAREDRPTFETFVGLGREAGCNGVLVVAIGALEFSDKTTRLPLVGQVTTRHALLRLTGGLIDVAAGGAVANLDVSQKRDQRGAKGPNCEQLLRAGVGSADLDGSAMGGVVSALRPALVKEVKEGLPRLTAGTVDPPPQRADQPADLGFEVTKWSLSIAAGYGQRDTVAVVNRGRTPRSFVIKPTSEPKGIFAAVLGQGAPDQPCVLAPRQWKYVRLIVNAPRQVAAGDLTLGLYAAAAGQAPNTNQPPADQAAVAVSFGSPVGKVDFQIVNQDPVTLAYTCRVINQSDSPVNRLRLTTEPNDGRVDLVPGFGSNAIHGVVVPANGSLTFQVVPHLPANVRQLEVKLRGWLGVDHGYEWPLTFNVPEGKRIFLGTGHTTQYMSDSFEACVNQGDILVDWGNVGGKMQFKCTTERDLGPEPPKGWRETEFEVLSFLWDLVLTTTGMPGQGGNDDHHERAADVRGMTIRPSVAARLADLDRDATGHPMAARGTAWLGLVWYAPDDDKHVAVRFASQQRTAQGVRAGYQQLSMPGHEARWPYLRARAATDQAYVVWEDSAPGKHGDVAYRASGRNMNQWREPLYLTDHGKGADDPVVQVTGDKTVGVAWCDLRDGGQVYLRLSQDDGRTFAPEVALPRGTGETQFWPQFAFTSSGMQLVWVAAKGAERQVMTCALDAGGRPTATPVVLSHAGSACGEPQVAANAKGDLAAVWREGEGDASEVWFASATAGGAWSAPKAMTDDKVYSEYPLVGFDGDALWATWHGDAKGIVDLKYYTESRNGGATWSPREALPSLENATQRAWLSTSVQLQWPRSSYKPFTLIFYVNDREVGRLANLVPDGNYLFEVPRDLVPTLASRLPGAAIHIKAEGCSGAHYLLATNTRLIVKRRFSQIPVVAATQDEADQLAEHAGAVVNHDLVDLVLTANQIPDLPSALPAGKTLALPVTIHNLGEKAATSVKVTAFGADPRDALAKAPKLGEVAVGNLAPGESRQVSLNVVSRAPQLPRLFVAASGAEPDAYPADNLWSEHFVVGEERARLPLVGTDVPDVLYAPALLPSVQLPNLPALRDLLAQPDLDTLLGHANWPMPSLPSLNGYVSQALAGLHVPNVTDLFPGLPSVPGVPGLPSLPRVPGLP